jgi:RNA polymerase sigma-70 factor (ECF subfamily)
MLRMVRRYTKDEDTAIEVVNNGMLRVFKKIHTYAFMGSLEGWVRRLVYRCMADHFRENARYQHFLVLEDHDLSVPAKGLDSFYEEDILHAVSTLPSTSQEVFRMFVIEGYSHAEIAADLKMSEGTSKWHLSTARQKLREMLHNEETAHINAIRK